MQFAKDSFFLALQERLAGLNPARTVCVNGATVPAVLVRENLTPSLSEPAPNTFYISWGAAQVVSCHAGWGALMSMDAVISYSSLGSVQSLVDRGRLIGQLDGELLAICQPPNTEKRDYSQSPSVDLGTRVFWSQPQFAALGGEDEDKSGRREDGRIGRAARITIYFWVEEIL